MEGIVLICSGLPLEAVSGFRLIHWLDSWLIVCPRTRFSLGSTSSAVKWRQKWCPRRGLGRVEWDDVGRMLSSVTGTWKAQQRECMATAIQGEATQWGQGGGSGNPEMRGCRPEATWWLLRWQVGEASA